MRAHRGVAGRQTRQREKVVVSLRGAKPVAQRQLVPGAVAYAQVPFADGTGWKSRPAVVVAVRGREVTVRPITTDRRWKTRSDLRYVFIDDWESAGLNRPSAVCPRQVTLDRMAITGLVGCLSESDRDTVLRGAVLASGGTA
jgi:hypothetical protein